MRLSDGTFGLLRRPVAALSEPAGGAEPAKLSKPAVLSEPAGRPPGGWSAAGARVVTSGLALAATLLMLAGCGDGAGSGGGTAASSNRLESAGQTARERAAAVPRPGDTAQQRDAGQPVAQARLAPARALVRKAELSVRVEDVMRSADRAGGIARDAGGEVYGDTREGSGDTAKADLVIKVESAQLDDVLTRVARLGAEEGRASSTSDVTESVADVDSRVASMRASISRVRALLTRATTVGDLVSVEGELSRREAELESLQARQRALAGEVALATVTVHLLAAKVAATPKKEHSGLLAGLRSGWSAFTISLLWLLTAFGAVLPFVLVLLPVLLGWRLAAVRRRAPRPAEAGAEPAG